MASYKKKKIILASGSSDRRNLLENLGIPFEVIVSDFNEEETINNSSLNQMCLQLAKGKCENVIHKIQTMKIYENYKRKLALFNYSAGDGNDRQGLW